jgi:hypothetical protein
MLIQSLAILESYQEMGRNVTTWLTTFDCDWKGLQNWEATIKTLALCSRFNKGRIFNVQEVCHSLSTAPTVVIRIITWHSPSILHPCRCWAPLSVVPWQRNSQPVPRLNRDCIDIYLNIYNTIVCIINSTSYAVFLIIILYSL